MGVWHLVYARASVVVSHVSQRYKAVEQPDRALLAHLVHLSRARSPSLVFSPPLSTYLVHARIHAVPEHGAAQEEHCEK